MEKRETLPARVRLHGMETPEKPAICVGKKAISYRELCCKIDEAIVAMKQSGIKKGDCILLSAAMKWEYVTAFLAVKEMRAIAVPILKSASVDEVEYIATQTDAKLFLTDSPKYKEMSIVFSFKTLFGRICSEMSDEEQEIPDAEVTEILFTSGTTGNPKGVVLSQSGIKASIHNTSTGMNMQPTDVLLMPLPLNHSFGLRVLRAALYNGETIVLQNGFSFAAELKNNIEQWKCNCMVAVASGFKMLLEQMADSYKTILGGLRYIEFGAGAVPVPMRKQLIEDLPNTILYNTWGSTETGGGIFLCFSEQLDKMESAGVAINDIVIGIADENNQIHTNAAGISGRLAIRSNARMLGYYKNEALTKEVLDGEWLLTNDAATMDCDGFVYLSGRIDDMISVGGEKIAPGVIERIALGVPGIKECACIGVEDKKGPLGQVPILYVIADDSFDEKKLVEQIRLQGNGFMIPQEIILIPEIPKNYIGKVDRKKLSEIWETSQEEKMDSAIGPKDDFANRVMQLMLTRRSVRNFTEKTVPREVLEKLVTAARMAPSGHNMQTWRFTVIQDQEKIRELKEITKQVANEKKTLFYGFLNPASIIIVSNDRRNPDALQDSSAAIENILLMAHALGVGACWINALIRISDEPSVRELLDCYNIPKTHIVHGIIGLGYPAVTVKTPAKKDSVVMFVE